MKEIVEAVYVLTAGALGIDIGLLLTVGWHAWLRHTGRWPYGPL